MSEIALWRAVIKQAVDDSRLTLEPLPALPPKLSREERWALPVEQRRAATKALYRLRCERTRILRDHIAKAEAIAWLRGADPDFKLVCDWADVPPDYVQRKAS
jgi:hypothetical protein